MIARGKREARRPWINTQKRDAALKGRNNISAFQAFNAFFCVLTRGDALALLALAPGYYIPRLRRWLHFA
jgi:hypothetical protein